MMVTAEDIEVWDAELTALTDGLGWLFARPEPKKTFAVLVRAMLADLPKKNAWGIAEHAGLPNPKRVQLLLRDGSWDADALRDWLRGYVVAGLADPDAALVLDDTQVIKKGVKSVGVARQHCGLTGQVENCQVMVMLSYASVHGHAFVDRELYLPAAWIGDAERRRQAGVPADRSARTKPQLGVDMLARAIADEQVRFRWVVADAGYGRDPGLRDFCHGRSLSYVVGVPVDLPLLGPRQEPIRPDGLLAATAGDAWQQRSCGHGSKGERYYDVAAHRVSVKGQPPAPGFEHILLIRRALTPKVTKTHPDGIYEVAYFLVHAPAGTPVPQMISAVGARWTIEDDNKAGKDQFGLDHYQVRKWRPWHRHVTISMLAHAFLAVTRAGLGKDPTPATHNPQPAPTPPWPRPRPAS
jgi:SRSO17 transposase